MVHAKPCPGVIFDYGSKMDSARPFRRCLEGGQNCKSARPGTGRGKFMVRRTSLKAEAVIGAGIHLNIGARIIFQRVPNRIDFFQRNQRIAGAIVQANVAGHPVHLAEMTIDTVSVKGRYCTRSQTGGREKREFAPRANPKRAELSIAAW